MSLARAVFRIQIGSEFDGSIRNTDPVSGSLKTVKIINFTRALCQLEGTVPYIFSVATGNFRFKLTHCSYEAAI